VCKWYNEAIPVQAYSGPEDLRRLRLPDFKIIGRGMLSAFILILIYVRG
jgi:hypothetical protein